MKRSLLSRLRSNGISFIMSGILLLLGIPLYQIFFLGPTGFSNALDATGLGRYTAYLTWISMHSLPFLIYRALLIGAFFLLTTFPFALHRIIIAQELVGQTEESLETDEATDEGEEAARGDGIPEHPWRGKGFVVLAAWLSLIGLTIYLLGATISTAYLILAAGSTGAAIYNSVTSVAPILTIVTNVVGTGLIGLGCLFFGGMIARTGKNLWPGVWVGFGYAALFVGAILCISAVAVASAAGTGQSTLTTIATLLFAVWVIWLGSMLVRLKPEP